MSSFVEAFKIIQLCSGGLDPEYYNWTYFTGPMPLLKLTRQWKKYPPGNNIIADFHATLRRPPPFFIKPDFTMFESVLTWSDLRMNENDLDELVDNLFYFGLEPIYDIEKFKNCNIILDFIPRVLAIRFEKMNFK